MAYLGRQPIIGNYQVLDAITASATATYALTKNSVAVFPQTPANCIVSLNGVIQAPTDSYTISGSDIVFASALTGSDSIDFITVLGDVLNVGTVSDGTIGLAKLSATGTKDATTFLRGDNTFASAGGTNTPAFKATKNTTTSLTANTYTKVPFNNEIFDTDSCYDNATNYRFTPNVAGKYLIYGHLWSYMQSTAAQSSQFRTSLYKNGAEDFTATVLQGTSGNNIQQENAINIVSIQEANGTTDYFEIYVRVSDNNATMYQGEFGAYKIIE
jgi:hypothetical protein